jgi:hypothetical protein
MKVFPFSKEIYPLSKEIIPLSKEVFMFSEDVFPVSMEVFPVSMDVFRISIFRCYKTGTPTGFKQMKNEKRNMKNETFSPLFEEKT